MIEVQRDSLVNDSEQLGCKALIASYLLAWLHITIVVNPIFSDVNENIVFELPNRDASLATRIQLLILANAPM